jgi:hypothetical protein
MLDRPRLITGGKTSLWGSEKDQSSGRAWMDLFRAVVSPSSETARRVARSALTRGIWRGNRFWLGAGIALWLWHRLARRRGRALTLHLRDGQGVQVVSLAGQANK